jgi:hypothetical protein
MSKMPKKEWLKDELVGRQDDRKQGILRVSEYVRFGNMSPRQHR